MYFPYLRGRQNELLCLRELLETKRFPENVIPVLEPVRYNSTFFSTIKAFIDSNHNVILIKNPKVGKYNEDYKEMEKKIRNEENSVKKNKLISLIDSYNHLLQDTHVLNAYLCDTFIISECLKGRINVKNIVLINKGIDTLEFYEDNGELLNAKLTFIPKDLEFKDAVYGDIVELTDCYVKAKRNVDYLNTPDEIFSKDHLNYVKNGFFGFSDFSIVGDAYEESGFAPLAIAIHVVYFDAKKKLRIHHFVSDSNENIFDPARKFEEAMKNLLSWENYNAITMTYGLQTLIHYYENGRFPGLGIIKKYTIMHHLELIGNYLEGK